MKRKPATYRFTCSPASSRAAAGARITVRPDSLNEFSTAIGGLTSQLEVNGGDQGVQNDQHHEHEDNGLIHCLTNSFGASRGVDTEEASNQCCGDAEDCRLDDAGKEIVEAGDKSQVGYEETRACTLD